MTKKSLIVTAIATLAIATALFGSIYVMSQQQLASAMSMNSTGNKTGMGNSTTLSPGKISSRNIGYCEPYC
jgi:hypothetical protein